jgi:hypothetical protein
MGDLIPPVLCYVFDWILTDHLRVVIVLVCLTCKTPHLPLHQVSLTIINSLCAYAYGVYNSGISIMLFR